MALDFNDRVERLNARRQSETAYALVAFAGDGEPSLVHGGLIDRCAQSRARWFDVSDRSA